MLTTWRIHRKNSLLENMRSSFILCLLLCLCSRISQLSEAFVRINSLAKFSLGKSYFNGLQMTETSPGEL